MRATFITGPFKPEVEHIFFHQERSECENFVNPSSIIACKRMRDVRTSSAKRVQIWLMRMHQVKYCTFLHLYPNVDAV